MTQIFAEDGKGSHEASVRRLEFSVWESGEVDTLENIREGIVGAELSPSWTGNAWSTPVCIIVGRSFRPSVYIANLSYRIPVEIKELP